MGTSPAPPARPARPAPPGPGAGDPGARESMARWDGNRLHILPGVALALLGLWALWEGVRLSLGSWVDPGPGMFPALVGGVLAVCGALLAVRSSGEASGGEAAEGGSLADVVKGAALTVGFVLALPRLGMALSLALVTALWVWWVAQRPWRAALVAGVVVAAGGTVLFHRLFELPLPVWPSGR